MPILSDPTEFFITCGGNQSAQPLIKHVLSLFLIIGKYYRRSPQTVFHFVSIEASPSLRSVPASSAFPAQGARARSPLYMVQRVSFGAVGAEAEIRQIQGFAHSPACGKCSIIALILVPQGIAPPPNLSLVHPRHL